jgi:hypothetical protein
MKLNLKTKRAIQRYGMQVCIKAHELNCKDGEGASTIGIYLGLTTRQADAAIDAGRELSGGK